VADQLASIAVMHSAQPIEQPWDHLQRDQDQTVTGSSRHSCCCDAVVAANHSCDERGHQIEHVEVRFQLNTGRSVPLHKFAVSEIVLCIAGTEKG
jgi:hypothetical protein